MSVSREHTPAPAAAPPLDYEQRDALVLQAARDSKLSPSAKSLLTVLALGYYNVKRGDAYPSRETLAEELDLTVGQISRAVKELSERGYITTASRPGHQWRSNLYRLLPPQVAPVPLDRRRQVRKTAHETLGEVRKTAPESGAQNRTPASCRRSP